jgi:hypothetical protein
MLTLKDLFACDVELALFDGEGDGDGGAAPITPEPVVPAAPPAKPAPAAGPKVFTQEDLNRVAAKERRELTAKIEMLENSYKQALENQSLTEQQRAQLQEHLEQFQATYRTKEESLKLELEKKEKEGKKTLETLVQERDSWKNRFETTEIRRSLQDAATRGEAYRAEHILSILQPLTKIVQVLDASGKPTGELAPRVHYPVVDKTTGEVATSLLTGDEAVSLMKSKPEEYGYLFRSNANGGLGGGNGTGTGMPGKGAKVDVSKLTHEEYKHLRKTNPTALGL